MPVKPTLVNLETMSMNELVTLRANITVELERREREEYGKAVEEFHKALYKLYSDYPNKSCMIDDDCETWETLYEDHNWNF